MKNIILSLLFALVLIGCCQAQTNTNYIAILLPSPSGVTDCIAEDINDNGMIVGGYSDGSGFSHLVVWTNCLAMAATEINPPPGYQFTALSGHDTPTLDGNGNIACFVSSGTNNNNSNISANPLYPCFIKWDSSSNTWSSSILYTNYLDYNDYLVISPLGKLIASLYGDNQIISWDSPSSPPVFSMPTSMLYSPNTVYSDVFFADDLNHAIGDCSTNNSASYQGAIWDLTKTNSPPTLLPYLSGYSDNQAHSMNHNGWIVGWANGNQTITPRPILWTNTSDLPVALKIPSSAKFGVVFSVNDSNQIVGIESNGNQMCALIYSGTNMAFLPIKSGYTQSAAVKINAHGFIAGAIVTSNNQSKGCVWAPIATPTVTFTQPTTPVVYAAGKTFSLSATSTSGGTITYSSSNTNVVSVSGSTATIKGVGTATLTATVTATANFTSASATKSVTVTAATPTVTFTQPTTPVVYAAGKTFSLSATSTSGGTITYSSSNTNVVSVSGSTATIKGVGTATLTATVTATANFTSASATKSVTVTAATPTVTFTQPTTPVVYAAGKTFSLSATSTSGGTITYSSSNTNVVSVSGSTATIKGVGTATLTATVAATANFTSASAARNVTVR